MNKEQLQNLLTALGVNSETLLLKLINEKGLTEEKIRGIMKAKAPKYITNLSDVRPGMFLTKEGYVTRNYIADDVIALVFGVFKKKIEVISVEGKEMPFGSPELFVDTDGLSGLEATRLIAAEARRLNLRADAAVYCQNFTVPGLVEQGEAFLLSPEEIIDIHSYFYNIQEALHNINFTTGFLWSSSMLKKQSSDPMIKVYEIRSPVMSEEMPDFPQYVYPAFFVSFRKP